MSSPFPTVAREHTVRYHAQAADNLFQPIPFGFVTERMCAEILAERRRILGFTPPARRGAQHRLFTQYDPRGRAEHFRSLLRPFVDEGAIPPPG